jgi:hypothetical protein
MANHDMSVREANSIRRKLFRLIDKCEIYPRANTNEDKIALALFSRMGELHKSICALARLDLRRDAVILGRTLCEGNITYYWLTNNEAESRFERYAAFGAQVRHLNVELAERYFAYRHIAADKQERRLLEEAAAHLKPLERQWNRRSISKMAGVPDTYNVGSAATSTGLTSRYDLAYFWFSLHSHPCVWAVRCFLPPPGEVYRSSRAPRRVRDIAERHVVFLSTLWLYSMALRVNNVFGLRRSSQFRQILWQISRSGKKGN